jgi:hypothetical protein
MLPTSGATFNGECGGEGFGTATLHFQPTVGIRTDSILERFDLQQVLNGMNEG